MYVCACMHLMRVCLCITADLGALEVIALSLQLLHDDGLLLLGRRL